MRGPHLRQLLDVLLRRDKRLSSRGPKPLGMASGPPALSEIRKLARSLLSHRGEASGLTLAEEILRRYAALDEATRMAFFIILEEEFGPDWEAAERAWAAHSESPSREGFRRLARAIEAPRQELFRRLNTIPGGTAALVALRADLLSAEKANPALGMVDDDLRHLLQSWFNRGFLVMRQIDWFTPAELLERIIRYEAVHRIGDWEELQRRVRPQDRRCYAFFHPAMAQDPLIFVEVALTDAIPSSIQDLLAHPRVHAKAEDAKAAVFYSISNCQPGLAGVSFGNFLIKQVVEELSRELPGLSTFVTLSPVPGFRRWLDDIHRRGEQTLLTDEQMAKLDDPSWPDDPAVADALQGPILELAHRYMIDAKDSKGRPLDPVARFHLGNGARLERIRWLGDRSQKGLKESAGVMVNYLYDLSTLEENHEAFSDEGRVTVSNHIKRDVTSFRSRKAAG